MNRYALPKAVSHPDSRTFFLHRCKFPIHCLFALRNSLFMENRELRRKCLNRIADLTNRSHFLLKRGSNSLLSLPLASPLELCHGWPELPCGATACEVALWPPAGAFTCAPMMTAKPQSQRAHRR